MILSVLFQYFIATVWTFLRFTSTHLHMLIVLFIFNSLLAVETQLGFHEASFFVQHNQFLLPLKFLAVFARHLMQSQIRLLLTFEWYSCSCQSFSALATTSPHFGHLKLFLAHAASWSLNFEAAMSFSHRAHFLVCSSASIECLGWLNQFKI